MSKYLALHLRHRPDAIGLELGSGGWVAVDELLAAAARHGFPMTRAELDAAVAEPRKRRYAYDDTGTQIRAVQGHSVDVELGYEAREPPEVLFHGTHPGALEAIRAAGLQPMRRTHVHLSADRETATTVGRRRGRPIVLEVDAGRMYRDGRAFFRAANGVWLTAAVPPRYLGGELP